MSSWRASPDATGALHRLTSGERRTLRHVARLPLVWAGVLAALEHHRGAESTHRRLARLEDAGLVAWIRSSGWPVGVRTGERTSPDRPPRLYYPTDLGLANLALEAGLTPSDLARHLGLRRQDVLNAVAGLPQLAAAYTLIGLLAAARPAPCTVRRWERPWRRRFRVPTAAAPVAVGLPAATVLDWSADSGSGRPWRAACLLLPDLAVAPVAAYRHVPGRLLDWRLVGEHDAPSGASLEVYGRASLLIATTNPQRARAWQEVLSDACAVRREAPLPASVVTWSDLRRTGGAAASVAISHVVDTRQRPVQGRPRATAPSRGREALTPASLPPVSPPQLIGSLLEPAPIPGLVTDVGRRPADPPAVMAGAAAVGFTDADRMLLDTIGRHPFLPATGLARLLGWTRAAARRRGDRLAARGLLRVAEPEEVPGADAGRELMELSASGLIVAAAQLGLTVGQATRHVGLAGGGPPELSGRVESDSGTAEVRLAQPLRSLGPALRARRRLLRHAAHTLGADAVFVELAAVARRLATAGVDAGLEEWRGATACARGPVRPDGYAILRHRGRRFGFFLEYDRGTERPAHYLAKLEAYYTYRDSGRFSGDYDGFPAILVVTTDTDAERRIVAVAAATAVGRSAPLPVLLTCEWRYRGDRVRPSHPEGLLGPVWRTPETLDRRRWPVP